MLPPLFWTETSAGEHQHQRIASRQLRERAVFFCLFPGPPQRLNLGIAEPANVAYGLARRPQARRRVTPQLLGGSVKVN